MAVNRALIRLGHVACMGRAAREFACFELESWGRIAGNSSSIFGIHVTCREQ
jgi:hypothetical protein